ncbi:ABA4-like family protein [Peteryoungia algae]|uniref:ABA4-like family protein n=1 Tax=Peteryoungia algae TaxID=2919917 RepID=A0ABT0D2K5_9HYPH|nr:ABA4-like family protein [Rhizobium sp. SSM4.3]MCJ8239647.1 ABA4-like family protein [Rhizobium sp. SSM4.3]
MSPDTVFSTTSSTAMAGWLLLILAPRWPALIGFIRCGLIGALSLTYAVLIFVYFFRVEGGGFGSIAEVRTLFLDDPVLVAGWVHYLAFDLFIGTWIAVEADRRGYNRLLQAPMLVATFMFGPLGLLLFFITRASEMALTARKA